MTAQSTPTPWVVDGDGDICAPRKTGKGQEMIATAFDLIAVDGDRDANAALIVRAVNSHKPMANALKIALGQLELLGGKRRKHPREGQDEIHAEVLEIVDAALKLAGVE